MEDVYGAFDLYWICGREPRFPFYLGDLFGLFLCGVECGTRNTRESGLLCGDFLHRQLCAGTSGDCQIWNCDSLMYFFSRL